MIHHVFANRSNVGDWLSARGIQALLGPVVIQEHLCDEPFVPETLERLSRAGGSDLIVIGGGGLFMDYFEPFWKGFDLIADQVSFCIWGVGLVDLKLEPSRPPVDLIASIVRRSRFCVVRDELTRSILPELPLPPPVPCPSLAAVRSATGPGDGVLHVSNFTTVGAEAHHELRDILLRFAEGSGRRYRETDNRIEPEREDELRDVLARYERSDLVVSSALHGCAIAVAMGRPVIAVSGDRKIESFMEAAGLGEWVLDQRSVAELPRLLAEVASQTPAAGFLERALNDNGAVARRVLELATGVHTAGARR